MEEKKIVDELIELFKSLSKEEWKLKVNSNWTIREVLVHLIGWEQEFIVDLMDSWKSKKPPWFTKSDDYDSFNALSVKMYKDYLTEDLIDRFETFIRIFNDTIKDLDEEKIREKTEIFSWVFDESHYKKHLTQIKDAIKK